MTRMSEYSRRYLMSVPFPVNGPKRMSPNGGRNVNVVNASSCVIGWRLKNMEQ